MHDFVTNIISFESPHSGLSIAIAVTKLPSIEVFLHNLNFRLSAPQPRRFATRVQIFGLRPGAPSREMRESTYNVRRRGANFDLLHFRQKRMLLSAHYSVRKPSCGALRKSSFWAFERHNGNKITQYRLFSQHLNFTHFLHRKYVNLLP